MHLKKKKIGKNKRENILAQWCSPPGALPCGSNVQTGEKERKQGLEKERMVATLKNTCWK